MRTRFILSQINILMTKMNWYFSTLSQWIRSRSWGSTAGHLPFSCWWRDQEEKIWSQTETFTSVHMKWRKNRSVSGVQKKHNMFSKCTSHYLAIVSFQKLIKEEEEGLIVGGSVGLRTEFAHYIQMTWQVTRKYHKGMLGGEQQLDTHTKRELGKLFWQDRG